jgi:hypothetical protein
MPRSSSSNPVRSSSGSGTAAWYDPAAQENIIPSQRLPRTTGIVRKSAQVARLMSLTSTPAVAVRDTLMAAVSRLGPGLVLRTFDGIADWQPPQRTYAAGAQDVQRHAPQDVQQ